MCIKQSSEQKIRMMSRWFDYVDFALKFVLYSGDLLSRRSKESRMSVMFVKHWVSTSVMPECLSRMCLRLLTQNTEGTIYCTKVLYWVGGGCVFVSLPCWPVISRLTFVLAS